MPPDAESAVPAAPRALPSDGRVLRYAAVVVAVATVPVLLWKMSDVILLTVGALLIATLLEVVAEPLGRWTPLPAWSRLLVAGLVVLGLLGLPTRHPPWHPAETRIPPRSSRCRGEGWLPVGRLDLGTINRDRPGRYEEWFDRVRGVLEAAGVVLFPNPGGVGVRSRKEDP